MNWQIILGFSILIASIQTLLSRYIVKTGEGTPESYGFLSNFLTGILLTSLIFIFKPSFANLSNMFWPILVSTIIAGLGTLFAFRALKLLEASEFTVLFSSRVIWVILISTLFFRERFYLIQLLGALFILFSIYLASWHSKSFKLEIGEKFALLSAVCFGISFSIDNQILKSIDVFLYISITFLLSGLFVGFLSPKKAFQLKPLLKKTHLPKILILSTLYAISGTTFFLSLQMSGNASQIQSINQTQIILTVLLAIIFLKERKNLFRKLIAAVICFIGVLLVT